jgi:hypothetical protein
MKRPLTSEGEEDLDQRAHAVSLGRGQHDRPCDRPLAPEGEEAEEAADALVRGRGAKHGELHVGALPQRALRPQAAHKEPFRGKRPHYNNTRRAKKALENVRKVRGAAANNGANTVRVQQVMIGKCGCTKDCYKGLPRDATEDYIRRFWALSKLDQDALARNLA